MISLVKNKARVINFCGKTNLDQLSAFFTNVDFLVHFDNGMGHFAAAAGCPTITLFSNSNPMQFKPIQDNAMIVSVIMIVLKIVINIYGKHVERNV